ncbi:MATE family efflux transporter [Sediminitomix flava]|uniref:Multidrug export protein MepA n=1 Tax=Sediminitomix flava TaxID=379075 RepID=A0A315ZE37_SEDFL|nr:MATE family efflux transporter [Sediminitomix flava]PWJ43004.1 putative MATE family efflux protein [Sediminitomix flava]
MEDNNRVLEGKVVRVFFTYTVPVILGLVAVSSAGIIDGIFLGHYVGTDGLTVVSICAPILPFIVAFDILLSTGGEVFCGKYIGEGKFKKASQIFSMVSYLIWSINLIMMILGLTFVDELATFLGADQRIHAKVVDYLSVIIMCIPFLSSFGLSYFARVDGLPKRSSLSLIMTGVLNVILDYIFIGVLDWGVEGAAWGTSLSYLSIPILLMPHFFSKKGHLKYVLPNKHTWSVLKDIVYNGSSELLSEVSGGLLFYLTNITMMKYYGTNGVAAYSVIGYLLYFNIMVCYGLSDGVKSIISINYGAELFRRVAKMGRLAIANVLVLGLVLVSLVVWHSDSLVLVFLKKSNTEVIALAQELVMMVWPALLFIGVNLILSSYFTAVHSPRPSLIISLSRSLVLPIIFIIILTKFFKGEGVIYALILSEAITLLIGLFLLQKQGRLKALAT